MTESSGPDASNSQAASSLSAQINVLNATVESQITQYQSALEELTSDHDCITADLRSEIDSIKAQLDKATAIIQNRSAENAQLQDAHDDETACLRQFALDQATTADQELTSIRAELQDSRSKASNDLITELRSELSTQFGISSALRCHLADSKSELDKVEIDLDRLRSDFAHCDHQYSATKAELSSCQDELARSTEAANQYSDILCQNAAQIKDLQDELSHAKTRLLSVTKETESVYAQHEDQRQVISTLRTALREANDAIHTLQRDGPSSPSGPLTTSAVQCQTILQGLPSCDSATQTTRRELNDPMGSMATTPEPEVSAPSTHMEEPSGVPTHTDEPSGVITPSTQGYDRHLMPPLQSTSVSWADSSEREALYPPAYIPPTDQLPLPSDLEAPQAQATGRLRLPHRISQMGRRHLVCMPGVHDHLTSPITIIGFRQQIRAI